MLGWLTQSDVDQGYSPRRVETLGFVTCGQRDDYVWVRLDPPLEPGEAANKERIEIALLAPRHEGASLAVPVVAAVSVYVCTLRAGHGQLPAVVRVDDVAIRHWGVVHPSLKEALAETAIW